MNDRAPRYLTGVADCVEQTLSHVGRKIVLCAPLGAGKPVPPLFRS